MSFKHSGMEMKIVKVPAFAAVGLVWTGTYQDVVRGELSAFIGNSAIRLRSLPGRLDPDIMLGCTYHDFPDGFSHYALVRVEDPVSRPSDMSVVIMPELSYIEAKHPANADVTETYGRISQFMAEERLIPYREPKAIYHDDIPIKHEHYDIARPLSAGETGYTIRIPIGC